MARYLLFAGDRYYPAGGMNDLVDSFSESEVEALLRSIETNAMKQDWWHVLDIQTGAAYRSITEIMESK